MASRNPWWQFLLALSLGGLAVFAFFGIVRLVRPGEPPVEQRVGTIDLRRWSFSEQGPVRLDGNWEFFWQTLLEPQAIAPAPTGSFKLPGAWNGYRVGGKSLGGDGYATFRLTLRVPEPHGGTYALKLPGMYSAYRLYVNDTLVAHNGVVATRKAAAHPESRPQVVSLPAPLLNASPRDPAGALQLTLLLQITNFHYYQGGSWDSLYFGEVGQITELRERNIVIGYLVIGSLLIMGLYHLTLFWLRRKDRTVLCFGVLSLLLAVRGLFSGDVFLFTFFPQLSWEGGLKLLFGVLYAIPAVSLTFFVGMFPNEGNRMVLRATQALGAGLVLFVFVFPARVYSALLPLLVVVVGLIVLYTIIICGLAAIRRRNGALIVLVGISAYILASVNDLLNEMAFIHTGYFSTLGFWFFIFAQSFVLSMRFARAFVSVEQLSESLLHTNEVFVRFVPKQFLSLLGDREITAIQLGDQVQREMAILFSDIRSFTTLSETMTPAENFAFMNAYLARVGPAIRAHEGVIDKYLGDGIMALFPGEPSTALRAALAMRQSLREFNDERQKRGRVPIEIGIGIHTGNLMLGTIGENERMECTVISDAVNIASRLDGLTSTYGAPILISGDMKDRLGDESGFVFRFLDTVTLRGRTQAIALYEVLEQQGT